jgi:peptidoglycan hydrolase-like protein with peptidoglycan-binding domain
MPPVAPGAAQFGAAQFGAAAGGAAYDQPAYDQPVDYQTNGGGPYSEPYEGPYADDYDGEPAPHPRSSRAAMIGIGVAAGAVLVIVVSLITIGGSGSTPAAAPGSSATEVVTPPTPAASSVETSQAPTTAGSSSAPTTSSPSTAPHPPGTLALGVTGNDVKWLQGRLKQLHLYNGEISGTFDAATQAAVVGFQGRSHTSDPSGVVGRSTKTALIAAGSKPQLSILNPGGDHHGKGANPEDVKRLQRALSSALNRNVKATGQFDMDTVGAVVQYQAAVGLGPDGIAGDKVWSALQQGRITG